MNYNSNLVAFGCSFTFGSGYDTDLTFTPIAHAWPNKLAEKLRKNCVNSARPGASNIEILNKVLVHDYQSSDTIVVMWSFFDRDLIFLSPTDSFQILPGIKGNDNALKSWAYLHTDYDIRHRSWMYMYLAWLYLKNLKAEFYFCLAPNVTENRNETFLKTKPKWANDIDFILSDIEELSKLYGYADDSSHPSKHTHEKISELIFDSIINIRKQHE